MGLPKKNGKNGENGGFRPPKAAENFFALFFPFFAHSKKPFFMAVF